MCIHRETTWHFGIECPQCHGDSFTTLNRSTPAVALNTASCATVRCDNCDAELAVQTTMTRMKKAGRTRRAA